MQRPSAELDPGDLPEVEFPPPAEQRWQATFADGATRGFAPALRLASNERSDLLYLSLPHGVRRFADGDAALASGWQLEQAQPVPLHRDPNRLVTYASTSSSPSRTEPGPLRT